MDRDLRIALITDVFADDEDGSRLRERLREALREGAETAVLPELPLNRWSPATKEISDADAEAPGGPRSSLQSKIAAEVGIGLIGGAIVKDPENGARFNTALVFDAEGNLAATYRKLHVPQEEGFWERSHYGEGSSPPEPIRTFSMPLGIQICSDAQRPMLTHALVAAGARAVVVPRATPRGTYDRWLTVFRANSITSGAYTLSINRPSLAGGDPDFSPGGPSVAVAPDGEVLLETTAPVTCLTLETEAIRAVQNQYPVYLAIRSDVYSEAWRRIAPRPGGEGE